ncbi:MAG: hypothetical protein FWE90_09615 [Defluviitaleaceae bacterium]|nr:hypothetical protein [Defluviitaleaceae bacterium]
MKKYLLGVDQGGTKSDYLLCTTDGEFVDYYNTITNVTYEHAMVIENKLAENFKKDIAMLLRRNGITAKDIAYAGIGMASVPVGADKVKAFNEKLKKRIGLPNASFMADPVISLYTDKTNGIGISVLSGTGCVVSGMGEKGNVLTVGGLRHYSNDKGSGSYIRDAAVTLLYEHYYKCGGDSLIFPALTKLLNINITNMIETIANKTQLLITHTTEIVSIVDNAALLFDPLAMKLLDEAGENMAQSTAGAIRLLGFEKFGTAENPLPVMLMGSIWQKVAYNGMREKFVETLKTLTDKECRITLYDRPPVISGLMLARSRYEADKEVQKTETVAQYYTFRNNIVENVVYRLAKQEIDAFTEKNTAKKDRLRFLLTFNKNRYELAQKIGVGGMIKGILNEDPLLRNIPVGMATAFMPIICAVAEDDYDNALEWFVGIYDKMEIPKGSEAEALQFGVVIAAAAENHGRYLFLSKNFISCLLDNGRKDEAKTELDSLLEILPDDEELLELRKRMSL